MTGNLGRVAALAQEAKRHYQPYGISDVPTELRSQPRVFVTAIPKEPYDAAGDVIIAPLLEKVVLRSNGRGTPVLHSETFTVTPVAWPTLFGGQHLGNRADATFPYAEFMALPKGDIEVLLVTDSGEWKCEIGHNDQVKIFGRAK